MTQEIVAKISFKNIDRVVNKDYYYGCVLVFDHIQELGGGGWDCRMYPVSEDTVSIKFLSPDKVLPYLEVGNIFYIWELGIIGHGIIVSKKEKS